MKKTIIGCISFLLLFLSVQGNTYAQNQLNDSTAKVYKMNYPWDIAISAAGYASNFIGLYSLREKEPLTEEKINSLHRSDIWGFDRGATWFEPFEGNAQVISDRVMQLSIMLPALLMFDKKIRKDWPDLLLLYLETHAINANLYTWGGPRFTKRIRPYVYNPGVSPDKKTGSGTTDSFYSGHTSTTATSSFFTAKTLCDYHPEFSQGKKLLIYSASLIPPAITGFFRYRAGKHFPTDIISGTIIGAVCGILIPELHRIKGKKANGIGFLPASAGNGMALIYRF